MGNANMQGREQDQTSEGDSCLNFSMADKTNRN